MNRHAVMMAAYLVVIALGAVMMGRHPIMGFVQILIGALLFGLRLHFVLKRQRR